MLGIELSHQSSLFETEVLRIIGAREQKHIIRNGKGDPGYCSECFNLKGHSSYSVVQGLVRVTQDQVGGISQTFCSCFPPCRPPSLEKLRAERLQREAAERARAEALLARVQGQVSQQGQVEMEETDERKRRYNSQFNPQLARRPRQQNPTPPH